MKSTGTEHSPDHVEGEHLYGFLVRVPPQAVNINSFVQTHQYDPCFNFPFFNQIQVPSQMLDVSLQHSNLGNTLGVPLMNPAF